MASEFEQIDSEVRAFQARREFVSIAVYKIVGEYAEALLRQERPAANARGCTFHRGTSELLAEPVNRMFVAMCALIPRTRVVFEGIRAETVMPVKSTAGKLVGVVDVEAEDDIDAAEIASFANMLAPLLATENEL